MKMKNPKHKQTLSEKIADSLTVKPRPDIEEDLIFGSKPKTVKKSDLVSSESEDDTAISNFRKANLRHLSEISKKYEGEIVSSKKSNGKASNESESEEESDNDNHFAYEDSSDDEKIESFSQKDDKNDSEASKSDENDSNADDSDSKVADSDSETGDSDSNGSDDEGYDISQMDEPMSENFDIVKKQNISEEVKKGDSVRNQLQLWENLLEMRIHLQRCMNSANRMPLPDAFCEMKKNNEFSVACNTTKNNVAGILDKLITLQNILFSKHPDTQNLVNKDKAQAETKPEDSDEEIPSDTESEHSLQENNKAIEANNSTVKAPRKRKLSDYEKEISTMHSKFKQFRNTTITKWHEKTRIVNSESLKSKNTNNILQQIEYILADRNKLVRRTQLKRSEYDIIGYKNTQSDEAGISNDRKEGDEYISEIFDDGDFYHQLLRELIECKSADITDPIQLSRQWIALQQMRSKMKRKVDTKATKGRRIKYAVHNKLINFMAPEKNMEWTDEMRNELYSSLFGKLFEYQNTETNLNGSNK